MRIIDMIETFVQTPAFDKSFPMIVELAGISYCDGSYSISRPKSGVACMEYVISGKGQINTKEAPLFPKGGDTYFLPIGEDHEYFSDKDEPWTKIWINVSGTLVSALSEVYSLNKPTAVHFNSEKYFREIHALLSADEYSVREISDKVSMIFHELIQRISVLVAREDISQEAVEIKNYIDKNIFRQITVEELSHIVYKSPAHTIRLFKKAYGVTPYKYYTDYRIKKAKSLLRDTNFSIKEIAFMMGFCDEHYFSGFFKSKTGKNPKEFRH